jgi:hypothetical protein
MNGGDMVEMPEEDLESKLDLVLSLRMKTDDSVDAAADEDDTDEQVDLTEDEDIGETDLPLLPPIVTYVGECCCVVLAAIIGFVLVTVLTENAFCFNSGSNLESV